MSMKHAFSAAGIAATVLLSSAASAETLHLDNVTEKLASLEQWFYSGTIEEAGLSVGLFSYRCGQLNLCHRVTLASIGEPEPVYPLVNYTIDVDRYAGAIVSNYYSLDTQLASEDSYITGYTRIDKVDIDGVIHERVNSLSYTVGNKLTSQWETYTYSAVNDDYAYSDSAGNVSNTPISFGEIGKMAQAIKEGATHVSGYDIFDFEKTIVHYQNGSVSLAQLMKSDQMDLADPLHGEPRVHWITPIESYDLATDTFYFNPITSITVAYGAAPAVPEPETWAMLLAGLGLLGSVARRRGLRA